MIEDPRDEIDGASGQAALRELEFQASRLTPGRTLRARRPLPGHRSG